MLDLILYFRILMAVSLFLVWIAYTITFPNFMTWLVSFNFFFFLRTEFLLFLAMFFIGNQLKSFIYLGPDRL